MEYRVIVEKARGHLNQVHQWRDLADPAKPALLSHAYHYASKAEALIELLEVELCGSTGGFDKGQGDKDRRTLALRLDWVEQRLVK